jgi:hypothetical protein
MIIFRKSTNTNSFGLRGYWAHNRDTKQLWSFATSHDLAIGDNVEPTNYELPRLEAQFQTVTQFEEFLFLTL